MLQASRDAGRAAGSLVAIYGARGARSSMGVEPHEEGRGHEEAPLDAQFQPLWTDFLTASINSP